MIESELVGLVVDRDALCPIFAPMYLTVATEDDVEFERESLLFAAGASAGTFIVNFFSLVRVSSSAHVWIDIRPNA